MKLKLFLSLLAALFIVSGAAMAEEEMAPVSDEMVVESVEEMAEETMEATDEMTEETEEMDEAEEMEEIEETQD